MICDICKKKESAGIGFELFDEEESQSTHFICFFCLAKKYEEIKMEGDNNDKNRKR